MKIFKRIILAIGVFLLCIIAIIYFTAFHPGRPLQNEIVSCPVDAPTLKPGQNLKVLNWNVQFMAGKEYAFFFEDGIDLRPSKFEISKAFLEVARVIIDEQPDMIVLQELDNNATRTDNENQLERLLSLLPDQYKCSTATYYWKAPFVPHPMIMGSVGLQLATISKYKIDSSVRRYMPEIPAFMIKKWLNVKRAILETSLPIAGGGEFHLMNTHLSAFAQGSDTMERQVEVVVNRLTELSLNKVPWVIGGDFNLLPPGIDRNIIPYPIERDLYKDKSELENIFNRFNSVVSLSALNGKNQKIHFTHFPNYRKIKNLDRTIDYIFYADGLRYNSYHVRQHDTQAISDHMPIIMNFKLPD